MPAEQAAAVLSEIDDRSLGNGKPGEVTRRLREIYLEESLKAAI